MSTIREQLGAHPFLARLEPRMLDRIAGFTSERSFRKGSVFVHNGAVADEFYLVVSGRAGIEIVAPGVRPMVIATVHGGEVIGWSWFVEPHRWHFDVVALDALHTLAVDAQQLRAACADDHELGYHLGRRLAQVMAARVEATRHQVVDLYGRR
jgi:CRP-like cAMP-binding protein